MPLSFDGAVGTYVLAYSQTFFSGDRFSVGPMHPGQTVWSAERVLTRKRFVLTQKSHSQHTFHGEVVESLHRLVLHLVYIYSLLLLFGSCDPERMKEITNDTSYILQQGIIYPHRGVQPKKFA